MGFLFYDNNGEWHKLCETSEFEATNIETEEITEEKQQILMFDGHYSCDGVFTTTKQSRIKLLQKVFCMSNNWLRMHGYPMKKKR